MGRGTVLTDTGELLRGGAVWVYRHGLESGQLDYAFDPAYYARLRAAQINAVRVICFDPWQRSHGYPYDNVLEAEGRARLLDHLDRVVALTADAGLYALINYHDVGRFDRDFADAFWQCVAPRYAHAPHVFYELLNEPVEWFPEHYTPAVLAEQDRLYRQVRALAPETHLVLLSFANTAGFVANCTMESVAAQLQSPDWTNASIGFHPYYTGGTSEPIQALRARYPVLNTELSPPLTAGGGDLVRPMDGEEWGTQTMERLGVSWFAWLVDGPERFAATFERGVWADAQAKGYTWKLQPPPAHPIWAAWRADLTGLPIRECNRVMGLRATQIAGLLALLLTATALDSLMLVLVVALVQAAAGGPLPALLPAVIGVRPFLLLAGLVFLVGLGRNAAQFAATVTEAWLYGRFSQALSTFAYRRYLSFGKSYFDLHPLGRLNSLVDYHHDVLNLYQAVLRAISTVLLVTAYFTVLLLISWRLSLIGLVLFPAVHLLSSWFLRRGSQAANEINRQNLDAGHLKWQMMTALPLFRAFAGEKAALRDYLAIADQFRVAGFRQWRLRGLTARLLDTGTLIALLAMLSLAVTFEPADPAHLAAMLVFFFVVRLTMPELARFQTIEAEFLEKLPKAREFAALFDDRGKFIVPSGDRPFDGLRDALEIRALTFRYPDGPPVLTGIHLRLPKGRTVALVGPSGGGKSTLTHLLMRDYDVTPGTIFLDDIDLREYSIPSLRRRFSIISQEVRILNQSLRQNLIFGLEREVSDAELRAALDTAQLSDLVATLPDGLDTSLGDSGSRLSGGQRQRVAIARALLKRADLLILDEATSALDALTEAAVQRAIDQVLVGTTSLVIAHRLTTIRRASHIVVLDGGRIVEAGTFEELLAQRGLFHRMWEQQNFS